MDSADTTLYIVAIIVFLADFAALIYFNHIVAARQK